MESDTMNFEWNKFMDGSSPTPSSLMFPKSCSGRLERRFMNIVEFRVRGWMKNRNSEKNGPTDRGILASFTERPSEEANGYIQFCIPVANGIQALGGGHSDIQGEAK